MTNYEMTQKVAEELAKAGASKDETMGALMALQTLFLAQMLDIMEEWKKSKEGEE